MSTKSEKTLLLLFSAGNDLFACDAEPIIEVIPNVQLKEIPKAPPFVAGLLNFGGQPIPVIDFCYLIKNRCSSDSLHTRIILVANPNKEEKELKILGIVAEKVTETTSLSLLDFIDPGLSSSSLPYLGGVLSTQLETAQLILMDKFFDEMKSKPVFSEV